MVGGGSAIRWMILHFVGYVVLVPAVLAIVAVGVVDSAALSFARPSAYPIWGGFCAVVAFVIVTAIGEPVQRRREVRAGYTTVGNSYQFVEQRDPKTGAVIRAAGAPFTTNDDGPEREEA